MKGVSRLIKYIFASHGTLAKGILSSVELILGRQSNVETLCAYLSEDFNLSLEVNRLLDSFSEEDEVIVLTDIFGGSVNNEFIQYIGQKNIHLISGMNLPLVIDLIVTLDENKEENLAIQIDSIIKNSLANIKYCNSMIDNVANDENF